MNLKRILLLAMIFSTAVAWGQSAKKDPVSIEGVSFSNVQRGTVAGSGGPVLRVETTVLAKSQPASQARSKSKWVRNVEVEIMLAYEDAKSGGQAKGQFVFLRSKAKIFAAKLGQKTPIVFYIPWEAYDAYGIKGEPYAYMVSLSANGESMPLTRANLKDRVSKSIDSMEALESFKEQVAKASSLNDGVLKPLNECATGIQDYEYGASKLIPTYMKAD